MSLGQATATSGGGGKLPESPEHYETTWERLKVRRSPKSTANSFELAAERLRH